MTTYTQWDVNKASNIGAAKGQAMGYVAGAYSSPGMTNLSAATAEAINQNGGSIYQDENGHFRIIFDRDTQGGSVWTSDALGMTFNYAGDQFTMTPTETTTSSSSSSNSGSVVTGNNSGSVVTGNSNGGYNSNFSSSCDDILNRLQASQYGGVSYGSTEGLGENETIDPMTGRRIDKEKNAEIDELKMSKSQQYKFDHIAKLMNNVKEAQSQATAVVKDNTTTSAAVGGALGVAASCAIAGSIVPGIGTLIGAGVGAVVGILGGKAISALSGDEAKANKVNNESAQAAADAGNQLKEAIADLSPEELIAFERYYFEQTGVEVSDVLKSLEVDEDSSTIAQQSGIDSEWLGDTFDKMDDAQEILAPDETQSTEEEYSLSEQANIQVLKQEVDSYYSYWQAALKGETVTIDGKTYTADQLKNLYLEKVEEYENYLNEHKD